MTPEEKALQLYPSDKWTQYHRNTFISGAYWMAEEKDKEIDFQRSQNEYKHKNIDGLLAQIVELKKIQDAYHLSLSHEEKYLADENLKLKEEIVALKAEIEKERWIPVNRDMDIPSKEVIAINIHKDYIIGRLATYPNMFFCRSEDSLLENVTHWKLINQPTQ